MLDKLNEIIKSLAKQCLKRNLNDAYFQKLAFDLAEYRDSLTLGYPSIIPTEKLKGSE